MHTIELCVCMFFQELQNWLIFEDVYICMLPQSALIAFSAVGRVASFNRYNMKQCKWSSVVMLRKTSSVEVYQAFFGFIRCLHEKMHSVGQFIHSRGLLLTIWCIPLQWCGLIVVNNLQPKASNISDVCTGSGKFQFLRRIRCGLCFLKTKRLRFSTHHLLFVAPYLMFQRSESLWPRNTTRVQLHTPRAQARSAHMPEPLRFSVQKVLILDIWSPRFDCFRAFVDHEERYQPSKDSHSFYEKERSS